MNQSQPLVCRCGNRGGDFQAWHSLPGIICRPVVSSGGRYLSPLASTAHDMRASLLARPTTATFRWTRDVSCLSHSNETGRLFHPLLQYRMRSMYEEPS